MCLRATCGSCEIALVVSALCTVPHACHLMTARALLNASPQCSSTQETASSCPAQGAHVTGAAGKTELVLHQQKSLQYGICQRRECEEPSPG